MAYRCPADPAAAVGSVTTDLPASGLLGAGAAGLYFAASGAVRLGALSGANRRFTGSYETGSFDPEVMPTTSWLVDPILAVDPDRWRLTIVDDVGRYQLGLDELAAFGVRMRATLDCAWSHPAGEDTGG